MAVPTIRRYGTNTLSGERGIHLRAARNAIAPSAFTAGRIAFLPRRHVELSASLIHERKATPQSSELSFTLGGTSVPLTEADIDEIFLPVLRELPVKALAAMTGLSERAIVKLRNRDGRPSLATALNLALADAATMTRLESRLRGRSALLKQQIAQTDLEIALLQAKRKELLDASRHGRPDQRGTPLAERQVQPGIRSAERLGGLVARLGRGVTK